MPSWIVPSWRVSWMSLAGPRSSPRSGSPSTRQGPRSARGGWLRPRPRTSPPVLALPALAHGREVVVSRGQLIEIGGNFRLPEVFEVSGARLREVGTTNRTRLDDYARAIGPETAALLRVHPSNYRIVGFTMS